MTRSKQRRLAVSLRSTGLGMAMFLGTTLATSRVTRTVAQKSYAEIKAQVARWLERYQPDVVVIEDYRTASHKGARQRHALRHLPAVVRRHPCEVEIVSRQQTYTNKFEEAAALANRFVILRDRVPKRPQIWEAEPHFVSLFEAVALGASTLDKSADHAKV